MLLHVLRVQVAKFKPIIPWLYPTLFENHIVAGWLDNGMVMGRLLLETVAAIPDADLLLPLSTMSWPLRMVVLGSNVMMALGPEQQLLVAVNSAQWVYSSGATSYGPASFLNVSAYTSVAVPMLKVQAPIATYL